VYWNGGFFFVHACGAAESLANRGGIHPFGNWTDMGLGHFPPTPEECRRARYFKRRSFPRLGVTRVPINSHQSNMYDKM